MENPQIVAQTSHSKVPLWALAARSTENITCQFKANTRDQMGGRCLAATIRIPNTRPSDAPVALPATLARPQDDMIPATLCNV